MDDWTLHALLIFYMLLSANISVAFLSHLAKVMCKCTTRLYMVDQFTGLGRKISYDTYNVSYLNEELKTVSFGVTNKTSKKESTEKNP